MTLVDVNGRWWTTEEVGAGDRTDAWEVALTDCYKPFRLDDVGREFDGRIRQRDLAGISLTECVCAPCSGHRLAREIADDEEPYVGVQIVLAGAERYWVGDDSIEVGPGDVVIWNSTQPTTFEITERLHKASITMPWAQLEERLPQGTVLLGCQLDTRGGIGSVLFSHIRSLVGQIDALEDVDARPIKRATLELVGAAAAHQLRLASPSLAREHLQRVQDYALDHLQDHDLNPTRLAQANAISVRYLHLLFEQTGQTVSQWIQAQRLAYCRDALESDVFATRNITEVAHQFGFNDSSHFSRVFKRQYGVSPAAYRSASRN